jgi:hypothetical protein
MKCNLIVVQGYFKSLQTSSVINFKEFVTCTDITVSKNQSKVKFYWYGNTVFLTKRGIWTIYINTKIRHSLLNLQSLVKFMIDGFYGGSSHIKTAAKICSVHISGVLPLRRVDLYHSIRHFINSDKLTNFYVKEYENTTITPLTSERLCLLPCCRYILQKLEQGTLRVYLSSKYSIISRDITHFEFWKKHLLQFNPV